MINVYYNCISQGFEVNFSVRGLTLEDFYLPTSRSKPNNSVRQLTLGPAEEDRLEMVGNGWSGKGMCNYGHFLVVTGSKCNWTIYKWHYEYL